MIDGLVTVWVDEGRKLDWLKKCPTLSFALMAIEGDGEVALVVFGGYFVYDFSKNHPSSVSSQPHIPHRMADA
jgi:hypothetical protein